MPACNARCTERTQCDTTLSVAQFKRLRDLGYAAQPATLSQTMGPTFRHIFFVSQDGTKKGRGRVHWYDTPVLVAQLVALSSS